MTVIGRLDEQVDAVLIAPLKRKQRADADDATGAQTQAADETEAGRAAPPGHAQHDKGPARRAADDELPVWLL